MPAIDPPTPMTTQIKNRSGSDVKYNQDYTARKTPEKIKVMNVIGKDMIKNTHNHIPPSTGMTFQAS